MAENVGNPTLDLAKLYAGKGKPDEVADFVRLQHLLSNPVRAAAHLKLLEERLEELLSKDPLDGDPVARAQKAHDLLDEALSTFEKDCDLAHPAPVLVGFASSDDFTTFTSDGRPFFDVGAGAPHGEMTHRIQMFIVMAEVTGGKFGKPVDPYHHTPRQLYAASLSPAYTVDARTPTKRAYMWDWVFDRIKGTWPTVTGFENVDYVGSRDAWTHPGETGTDGALSNDLFKGVPGLERLCAVRTAQYNGSRDLKPRYEAWFNLARNAGVARGKSAIDASEPTYFYPPTMATRKALRAVGGTLLKCLDQAMGKKGAAVTPIHKEVEEALKVARQQVDKETVARELAVAAVNESFGAVQQLLKQAESGAEVVEKTMAPARKAADLLRL